MTALVSLLFITMIPIDCKITNFSLYLYTKKVIATPLLVLAIWKIKHIMSGVEKYRCNADQGKHCVVF